MRPLLVLLHGFLSDRHIWSDVSPALDKHFELLMPELPGHGDSDMQAGDIAQVAQQLSRVVSRKAYWLGWSLGGILAMQVAVAFPRFVERLLLVSSSACFLKRKHWPHGMSTEAFACFRKDFEADPVRMARRFRALQVHGDQQAELILASLPPKAFNSRTSDWGLNILQVADLRTALQKTDTPVSMLHGREDQIVDCRAGEDTARLCNARFECWDHVSHVPMLADAPRFAHWVIREAT